MKTNQAGSFFAGLYQIFFRWRVDREIFERIFFHLRGDKNFGYAFRDLSEMDALTEDMDSKLLLEQIEAHIRNMPDAYGKSFRYVLHRDIHERLRTFESLAKRRVKRSCDPRLIASHA